MYLRPPKIIIHDVGPQFTSVEFAETAREIGSTTKCVLVEAHHSIGMVERYHAPLRRAYDIITKELPKILRQHALQMAVKAINDTAGLDGIVPTLLVYGSYPQVSTREKTSTTAVEQGNTIRKAMRTIAELNARRDVTEALHSRNRPDVNELLGLVIGEDVLV